MCSSHRKNTRTKYTYSPSNSPWNKKILFTLWAIQIVFAAIMSAVGGGLIVLKYDEIRYDDGISNTFYIIIVLLTCGVTFLAIGFLILQIYWFRRNELHPGWALTIDVCLMVSWLCVIALTLVSLIGQSSWSGTFTGFEVIEILCLLAGLPYIAGLVYSSIVYHNFRKDRKKGGDIEVQSLDSRKQLT